MVFLGWFFWVGFEASLHATLTVTPVSPYTKTDKDVFYAGVDPQIGLASGFMDSGYTAFDLTADQDTDNTSRSNMLLFDVVTDKSISVTSGQYLVLTVYAKLTDSSSTLKAVPIAAAGITSDIPDQCSDQDNCQAEVVSGRLFSVRYTSKTTLRIGVYPKDICTYVHAQATSYYAYGCNSSTLVDFDLPTAGEPTTFPLKFVISGAPDRNSIGANESSSAKDEESIDLHFQVDAPSYGCGDLSESYFPGDQEILFYPKVVSASGGSGAASVNQLLIVAEKGRDPVVENDTFTQNAIVQQIQYTTTEQHITGFANTTDGSDNSYNLAIGARNDAGIIADFDSACFISGVQTSAIQGFLSNNNCFIMSAVFRSKNAVPVKLLRTFRDHILLTSSLGRRLVHYYYQWSPDMADWLLKYNVVRFPLFLFLMPIEVIAWLLFNLKILFFLCACALSLLFWAVYKAGRMRRIT